MLVGLLLGAPPRPPWPKGTNPTPAWALDVDGDAHWYGVELVPPRGSQVTVVYDLPAGASVAAEPALRGPGAVEVQLGFGAAPRDGAPVQVGLALELPEPGPVAMAIHLATGDGTHTPSAWW